MKTQDEILSILAHEKPALAARFKVRQLALFGSYARGDARPESDIDVLVDVDPSIGLDFVTLAQTIERSMGQQTDVVSRGAVTPRSWRIIERDLIYV